MSPPTGQPVQQPTPAPNTAAWLEADRLDALRSYRILDTPREQDFDDIAQLASEITGTPIAMVSLIDDRRQWFKAAVGTDLNESALETSFCMRTLLEEDTLVVQDARADPRFDCNALVTGEPYLRFYAGAVLRTGEGLPLGTVCVFDTKPHDLTPQQVRALSMLARQAMTQMELRRAIVAQRDQETRSRQILDSASDYAIIATDLGGKVTEWNGGAQHVLGWSAAEMIGTPAEIFFTPDDRVDGVPAQEMRAAMRQGRSSDERWHLREDGTRFWALGELMPLRDEAGQHTGYVTILRDRTEQRRAEEEQRFLMEELSHRVKNTLAMVQAIATQTLRNSATVEDARNAFSERIGALAGAHDVLLQGSWARADLRTIVHGALRLHDQRHESRFEVDGPTLVVGPKPALALALMIHELGTNATKYGALSAPDGSVLIRWTCDENAPDLEGFTFVWREQRGPAVQAPTRKGFGSRLIERGLAGSFSGTVVTRYEPDGVVCTLVAPLSAVRAA